MEINLDTEILEWLLEDENPSVRYRTFVDLLGRPAEDPEVIDAKDRVLTSEAVVNILTRMHPDGYWLQQNPRTKKTVGDGVEYEAFLTTHFCLSYLAELGLDKQHPDVSKAANRYLDLQRPDGDFYHHFSCLYAFNIRTFLRLGFRDDHRLHKTIQLMLKGDRPDGGYLCDMHEGKYKTKAVKSCIRGSAKALSAFAELPELWEHRRCRTLVNYFLKRDCLYRTDDLSVPVNRGIVLTYYPMTWRASFLEIVHALSVMGYGSSPALARAWGLFDTKKDDRGRYKLDWTPRQVQKVLRPGKRGGPNKWVTLYALLAYKAAGIAL
jgi:hypothetical protein